jgi:hypothetical protein
MSGTCVESLRGVAKTRPTSVSIDTTVQWILAAGAATLKQRAGDGHAHVQTLDFVPAFETAMSLQDAIQQVVHIASSVFERAR